jgi:hypothetical protein
MSKFLVAIAVAGAMGAPLAAQTQAQPQANPEVAQTQPAQPQTVKKQVCRRVPDYPSSGTMLGPSHKECKTVEVPVKANGSATAQPIGETGAGGKK